MKLKKIKPLFTGIVVSANRYTEDAVTESGLVKTGQLAGNVKEYQTVLEIGSSVRDIAVGDTVVLNFQNFLVKDKRRPENDESSVRSDFMNPTYTLELPIVDVADKEVMLLDQRDIMFVAEVEEPKKSKLILPKAKTLKKTPKIIV